MRTWTLRRRNDTDFVFEGEHLITVDDREWLGLTPNWWELSLYRSRGETFVLESVYHQNYPRGKTLYGALELPTLDEVARCLLHRCGAPEVIIDALMARARRCLRFKDFPPPSPRLRRDAARPPLLSAVPEERRALYA